MQKEKRLKFQEWKSQNEVTLEFLAVIRTRIDELKKNLTNIGNSRETDSFLKGMIYAYVEVLDVKYDEIDEALENLEDGV
jgi:hypothetical protein